jgi:micrococcal nuclease
MSGRARLLWFVALCLLLAGCASPTAAPPSSPPPSIGASPTHHPARATPARGDATPIPRTSRAPTLGSEPTGPTQLAHVTKVTDGDTIHVSIDGTDYRLRYIGMDTPESVKPNTPVQPYAEEASAENARLVADRDVVLEKDVSETDRFGRLLRYVWLHDGDTWTMVNLALVENGYARVLTYPPDVKYADLFVAAARTAQQDNLGLWALP